MRALVALDLGAQEPDHALGLLARDDGGLVLEHDALGVERLAEQVAKRVRGKARAVDELMRRPLDLILRRRIPADGHLHAGHDDDRSAEHVGHAVFGEPLEDAELRVGGLPKRALVARRRVGSEAPHAVGRCAQGRSSPRRRRCRARVRARRSRPPRSACAPAAQGRASAARSSAPGTRTRRYGTADAPRETGPQAHKKCTGCLGTTARSLRRPRLSRPA